MKRALAEMTPEEKQAMAFPPPDVLIQPEEIAEAVVMFVQDDSLAGRVMVWPDNEPWRLLPAET